MKSTSLLLSLLISLLFENPVLALTLQDEISAYNKSNYSQAIAISHQLAKENPSEADCHYYAANSYSRLGQLEEAIREYAVCLNLTDDPQLKTYCNQALSFLTKNQPTTHSIISASVASAAPRVRHSRRYGSEISYTTSGPKFYYDNLNRPRANTLPPMPVQLNNLSANLPPTASQFNTIPGYMKPAPYRKPTYIDSLFNASPLPPPPFPTSAKAGAEKALNKKIN